MKNLEISGTLCKLCSPVKCSSEEAGTHEKYRAYHKVVQMLDDRILNPDSMLTLQKNNIILLLMSLFFGKPKSGHVLFSQKARELFRDRKTGDRIIEEISRNKKKISEGGNIRIAMPGKKDITLEGASGG